MIPIVDDLRSSPLVHRFGDCFNPPGLTNFLGCVQSDLDPVAIRSLNFPPFACSDTVTATLFLNGKIFAATGSPVTVNEDAARAWLAGYTYPDVGAAIAAWNALSDHRARMAPLDALSVSNPSAPARSPCQGEQQPAVGGGR